MGLTLQSFSTAEGRRRCTAPFVYASHLFEPRSDLTPFATLSLGHLRTSPSHRETGTANLQELNTHPFFFVNSTRRGTR